jgi:hypothetical protein
VCYHCGLLETSTSKGWRGQNREEEEKYATIGNLDCYRKNLGLSYEAWMGETPLDEVVLVSNPETAELLRKHGGSHGYLGHEFVMSILENRKPQVDIGQAMNMTVAGVVVHQSAIKDGELMKIPQYAL